MALTVVDGGLLNSTNAQYTGFKNRIINGAMAIDQRNAGASLSSPSAYTLDRWYFSKGASTATYTVQQSSTAPTGFRNSFAVNVTSGATTAAGQYSNISQFIEGYNIADLMWGTANAQPVTFSFWVRSSLTGTFGVDFRNNNGDRNYIASYTISSANTWEYKTISIAGDTSGTWETTNGIGIGVYWDMGVGTTYSSTAGAWTSSNVLGLTGGVKVLANTSASWYVTGVQLEKGSTATSFDYRPYGTELQLCQRYYEKSYNIDVAPATTGAQGVVDTSSSSNASNAAYYAIVFAVQKRTAPTMTAYVSGTGATGSWSYERSGTNGTGAVAFGGSIGTRSAYLNVSIGAAWTVCEMYGHWTASSEL
jgi:hypothetical protein